MYVPYFPGQADFQLIGSLLREGGDKDILGIDIVICYQVLDTLGDHKGLTCARTGDGDGWAMDVVDGLSLTLCEIHRVCSLVNWSQQYNDSGGRF